MSIVNRKAVAIRVQELREMGRTIREIAAETGVSVGTVHTLLREAEEAEEARWKATAHRHGWEYREPSKPTVKQVNAMRRYRRTRYMLNGW